MATVQVPRRQFAQVVISSTGIFKGIVGIFSKTGHLYVGF